MKNYFILFLLLICCNFANAQRINIAAAANLRYVMNDIIYLYESNYSSSKININYGASGILCQQIINGADYDLFISADMEYPQKVKNIKKIPYDVYGYTNTNIVLWSREPIDIDNIANIKLASQSKIAIANPKIAPYGRITLKYLQKKGVYEKIKSNIIFGENISQVAHFLETGNADIGFISLSLILSTNLRNKGNYYILSEMLQIKQGYIKLKEGNVDNFISFINGKKCKDIWSKHGYFK